MKIFQKDNTKKTFIGLHNVFFNFFHVYVSAKFVGAVIFPLRLRTYYFAQVTLNRIAQEES